MYVAGKPVLLEPIMKVDIMVPEEYIGEVIGDVNSVVAGLKELSLEGSQVIKVLFLCRTIWLCYRLALSYPGTRDFFNGVSYYNELPSNIAEKIVSRTCSY